MEVIVLFVRFLENNPGEALLKVIPVWVVSMLMFLFENISSLKTHYLYIGNLHSECMLVIVLEFVFATGGRPCPDSGALSVFFPGLP